VQGVDSSLMLFGAVISACRACTVTPAHQPARPLPLHPPGHPREDICPRSPELVEDGYQLEAAPPSQQAALVLVKGRAAAGGEPAVAPRALYVMGSRNPMRLYTVEVRSWTKLVSKGEVFGKQACER
jgi:hypothetical protein